MGNSNMETTLSFEDHEVKKLLSKLDIKFFLNQNIEENNYSSDDINLLYKSFENSIKQLKTKRRNNKKQFNYYLEGQTRKMFRGGFIPALFHLDNGRGLHLFDFKSVGKDLAYFKLWQDYFNSKNIKDEIWNYIIKIGSFLGIILAIIRLFELIYSKVN